MKKIICCLFIFIVMFSPLYVLAQDYQVNQLIPVDTSATVNTEKFNYQDFMYSSQLDGRGNARITFGSIHNNTASKVPVSINVLLFGEDQKNIGIVTYCANKDYGNNYEGFKLNGNQSAPFSINVVTNKYFVDGKGPKDVKYIAVLDENKYCRVGGYSNYEGLTIDEIVNGVAPSESSLSKYVKDFKDSGLIPMISTILVVFVGFVIYGTVVNTLHSKVYSKSTALAYLPITNIYVTFKLAFGKLVGLLAGVLCSAAIGAYVIGVPYLLYVVAALTGFAFIIIIVKLITKKYDEPVANTSLNNNNSDNTNNSIENSVVNNDEEALDLSYDDDEPLGSSDEGFDVSSGESAVEENTNNNEEKEEESDLSKFF